MRKLLALLLLSPLAFAEEVIVTDLIGWSWIESSAKNASDANHEYRFYEDGTFYAYSKPTDDVPGVFIWNGAYEMFEQYNSFSIFSDDMSCTYVVSKIGKFYRLRNTIRNFSNICPDLLIKKLPTQLK